MTKCGYISLLGRPNAGKSTLLNALLGAKISVVSSKPQTTRNKILGVRTDGERQLIFLDTPGIHKAEGLPKINKAMNAAAWSVISDSNLVCYLVDSERGWHEEDAWYLKGILHRSTVPVCVLLSKVDAVKKDVVSESMESVKSNIKRLLDSEPEDVSHKLAQPLPYCISAKRPEEVKSLFDYLSGFMPESTWYYSEDDLTDRPQQFICGELIREQIFRQLGQELPYNCAVRIDLFKHEEKITRISATIVVLKESYKGMVIGKGGSRLKQIGTAARVALEAHLERKVYLQLHVKIQANWLDDDKLLAEYASLNKDGSG